MGVGPLWLRGWGGVGSQPQPRSGSHTQAGTQLFYIKALREIGHIYAEYGDLREKIQSHPRVA